VDAALSGLGFVHADWPRSPLEMSGGEQTRAALARLVIADPGPAHARRADEPSRRRSDRVAGDGARERHGALVVAAHDRAFLDNVCAGGSGKLRDRRLEAFRGNYSAYVLQREERDARQRKDADDAAGGR
jgi:ATP-binding cassette subfamily F protein 3